MTLLVAQIRELTGQIARAVRVHPTATSSCPRSRIPKSVVTAARLVAEIGDNRSRYPSAEALAADAGMAPVARESGKRKVAPALAGPATSASGMPACLADSTQ